MVKSRNIRNILEAKVFPVRLQWVTEWVRCFRKLEFNEELHLGEIRLSVGIGKIIVRVNLDIRREIVPLSVRFGMCIKEYQFFDECRCCRYLSNVGKA
jgi:hypothetical protein